MNKIYVVGIGPGNFDLMTLKCREVIEDSQVIVGYGKYVELIRELVVGKETYCTGMRSEVDRCQKAIEIAAMGKKVSVVSSGDSGIYGMAGLLLELLSARKDRETFDVEVVPGVSASQAAASILGAPLMHDFVTISLSNWLTELDLIKRRLQLAAQGDFVVAIYNPKSKARPEFINMAQEILLEYKSGDTVVGIVRNAYRADQTSVLTTLAEMTDHDIDMTTMVIVGNEKTYVRDGKMITPRGYHL